MRFEPIEGNILEIHISGLMRRADLLGNFSTLVDASSDHKINVLVYLENFEGWDPDDDWTDTTLTDMSDEMLSKMAFVGDLKWRDDIYAFTLKGLRPVQIEFFEPRHAEAARAWLE